MCQWSIIEVCKNGYENELGIVDNKKNAILCCKFFEQLERNRYYPALRNKTIIRRKVKEVKCEGEKIR